MAETYRVTGAIRRFNGFMMWLARKGMGPSSVLTTKGRRTGLPRQVPVSPMTVDGVEYLVSPYGPVDWVRNVRAAPDVSLTRGGKTRPVRLVEVSQPQVVLAYRDREKFARRYMDLPENASEGDVEPGLFPVFRVEAL